MCRYFCTAVYPFNFISGGELPWGYRPSLLRVSSMTRHLLLPKNDGSVVPSRSLSLPFRQDDGECRVYTLWIDETSAGHHSSWISWSERPSLRMCGVWKQFHSIESLRRRTATTFSADRRWTIRATSMSLVSAMFPFAKWFSDASESRTFNGEFDQRTTTLTFDFSLCQIDV